VTIFNAMHNVVETELQAIEATRADEETGIEYD